MIKFNRHLLKNNSRGQVVIILLVVMVIALTVGVAISQRATSDIATSTQSEQSSQAFSAAEAGIERAIQTNSAPAPFSLGNQAQVSVSKSGALPYPGSGLAIEYPPIDKETAAQFWFTDSTYPYSGSSFQIYFGNDSSFNATDNIAPAVEVNVISLVSSNYLSYRYYFDADSNRSIDNSFNNCSRSPLPIDTILSSSSSFYCSASVPPAPGCKAPCAPYTTPASLVRVRLLYSNNPQKVALAPAPGLFFPPQIEVYNSTGSSGQSQVTLQYFKQHDLVPPWFDFAIFSVNNIRK